MTTAVQFHGTIPFHITGQKALPVWHQKALQDHLENGENGDGSLRFQCRIAQDANDIFEIFETEDGVFQLNLKAKAQFGRNSEGNAYLTVGVIHMETGDRYRLQWEGENVPLKMIEIAVKHDSGLAVKACTIPLRFEDAKVWKLGPSVPDNRPPRNKEKNGSGPGGSKRKHDRSCAADVIKAAEIAAARKPRRGVSSALKASVLKP